MKVHKMEDLSESNGALMLLYGEPGVGKSVTSIQTAKCPILYIMTEPRNVKNFIIAANRPDIDIDVAYYDKWDDTLEYIANYENFDRYNTVILDSLSHLIAINLSDEIMEESFESLKNSTDTKKSVKDKPLTMRAKMSLEGFGSLGTQMLRFTNLLSKLSQRGKVVVCLARMEQNPKYNRMVGAAPTLSGKEYPKHMQGFFDFIGLVETRVEVNKETKEEKVAYPPLVSFESDGSFMCKWTGFAPSGGVADRWLDIEKILGIAYNPPSKK